MNNERVIDTASSLAKFLKLSPATIRKKTKLGEIPRLQLGRAVRYDRADVLRHLQKRNDGISENNFQRSLGDGIQQ